MYKYIHIEQLKLTQVSNYYFYVYTNVKQKIPLVNSSFKKTTLLRSSLNDTFKM